MTKRSVMIRIQTVRQTVTQALFEETESDTETAFLPPFDVSEEPTEMLVEGRLVTGTNRVELIYEEGELTGMEGSVTSIGFDRTTPELVTMIRTGLVNTAMVFEAGKRHLCLYHTPFSELEICVRALQVGNRLLEEGKIELDYVIEIHGAQTDRCQMTICVHPSIGTDSFFRFT